MGQTLSLYRIVNSIFNSNTYIIIHTESKVVEAWIVDLGDIAPLMNILPSEVIIKGVLFTHIHFDHIYGVNNFLRLFPDAILFTNIYGKEALFSPKLNFSHYNKDTEDLICSKPENVRIINGGDKLQFFENIILRTYATPGHDASCITYVTDKYVFSGDSFIPNIETRATFPSGDKSKIDESETIIKNLARTRMLCPGHGPIFSHYQKQSLNDF